MAPGCEAPGTSCGSASGWRQKGRCHRCRAAHNVEVNKYRGLQDDQRAEVLALLRAGRTREEAAAAIGKKPQTLSAAAAQDGELWAALGGLPLQTQRAARQGDFLAALTRTSGNAADACRLLGVDRAVTRAWRDDPAYTAAEEAVLAWLRGRGIRPRVRVTDAMLDKAAALLEQGSTVTAAARAIGVRPPTLNRAAGRHPRLAAALAGGLPRRRGKLSGLTPQVEAEFRAMWADRGLSAAGIARRLNVGSTTMTNWSRELGLPSPSERAAAIRQEDPQWKRTVSGLTPQVAKRLRAMWADSSLSAAEIARRLGVTPSTVANWSLELGLPSPAERAAAIRGEPWRPESTSGLTPQMAKQLREMWLDNSLSTREIARRLGVSRGTVTNWRQKLELPSLSERAAARGADTKSGS